MIYYSFNFEDSFSNASGNRKHSMVLGELGKVIKSNPNEVISAMQDAEISIPKGIDKKGLIKLILQNKRNKRMIMNLSALIYTSASFDGGGDYDFLGRKKDGSGEDKGKLLQQVGDWLKSRKERKAQRKAGTSDVEGGAKKTIWQKIGGFFNKNKDKIGDVSSALADSLQNNSSSAKDQMVANLRSTTTPTTTTTTQSKGLSQNTKTMLIIGGVIALGVFLYMRKNK